MKPNCCGPRRQPQRTVSIRWRTSVSQPGRDTASHIRRQRRGAAAAGDTVQPRRGHERSAIERTPDSKELDLCYKSIFHVRDLEKCDQIREDSIGNCMPAVVLSFLHNQPDPNHRTWFIRKSSTSATNRYFMSRISESDTRHHIHIIDFAPPAHHFTQTQVSPTAIHTSCDATQMHHSSSTHSCCFQL